MKTFLTIVKQYGIYIILATSLVFSLSLLPRVKKFKTLYKVNQQEIKDLVDLIEKRDVKITELEDINSKMTVYIINSQEYLDELEEEHEETHNDIDNFDNDELIKFLTDKLN